MATNSHQEIPLEQITARSTYPPPAPISDIYSVSSRGHSRPHVIAPFVARSTTEDPEPDSDGEVVHTPIGSTDHGPTYEDLPPTYDEAQSTARSEEEHVLNRSEYETARSHSNQNTTNSRPAVSNTSSIPHRPYVSNSGLTNPGRGNVSRENIPIDDEAVGRGTEIDVHHLPSYGSVAGDDSSSVPSMYKPTDHRTQAILERALEFTRDQPDADAHSKRLTRKIAVPSVNSTGITEFLRAYTKALNPHSINPAQLVSFIDGLNVVCRFIGLSPATAESFNEPSNALSSYIAGANEAFFAPRGLRVSLTGGNALLYALEIPEPETRGEQILLSVKSFNGRPLKKAEVVSPWAEPLSSDVPEPNSQTLALHRLVDTAGSHSHIPIPPVSPQNAVPQAIASSSSTNAQPGPPPTIYSELSAEPEPRELPGSPVVPTTNNMGSAVPIHDERAQVPPSQTAGSSWQQYGEDIGARWGKWGEELGKNVAKWSQELVEEAERHHAALGKQVEMRTDELLRKSRGEGSMAEIRGRHSFPVHRGPFIPFGGAPHRGGPFGGPFMGGPFGGRNFGTGHRWGGRHAYGGGPFGPFGMARAFSTQPMPGSQHPQGHHHRESNEDADHHGTRRRRGGRHCEGRRGGRRGRHRVDESDEDDSLSDSSSSSSSESDSGDDYDSEYEEAKKDYLKRVNSINFKAEKERSKQQKPSMEIEAERQIELAKAEKERVKSEGKHSRRVARQHIRKEVKIVKRECKKEHRVTLRSRKQAITTARGETGRRALRDRKAQRQTWKEERKALRSEWKSKRKQLKTWEKERLRSLDQDGVNSAIPDKASEELVASLPAHVQARVGQTEQEKGVVHSSDIDAGDEIWLLIENLHD